MKKKRPRPKLISMGELKLADITQAVKDDMCDRIAAGESMDSICSTVGISLSSFNRLIVRDPLFKESVKQARVLFAHNEVERLRTIYDDAHTMTQVQKARGQSENIRWIASKYASDTFGDKLNVNVTHNIDLSKVLEQASNRLQDHLSTTPAIDVTPQLDKPKKSDT